MMRTVIIRSLYVLAILLLAGVAAQATPITFTIPEVVLLDTEFADTAWGGSVIRSDAAGDSVEFDFSGLSSASTGIKDDYLVSTLYGQIIPSHANGDFLEFGGYSLYLQNLDDQDVWVSLFINTGFTGPSGIPSNDPTNDTFWQSAWEELSPSESALLLLEFDNAIPWGVEDNTDPHTLGGTDGVAMAINDWDHAELSAIGFQLYAGSNPNAAILVTPYAMIPEPGSMVMLGIGLLGALIRKRS